MSHKSRPARFVTEEDCVRTMSPISRDVTVLKKALVGPDLRGGLVADMATMKGAVARIEVFMDEQKKEKINQTKNEKERGRDWRLLGFAVGGAIISGVVIKAVDVLIHLL